MASLEQVLKAIEYLESDFEKDIVDIFITKAEKDINKTFKKVIKSWYDSYPRTSYHPKKSLYDAYRIERSDDGILVTGDPSFITKTHRLGNQGIYELVFQEGFHGGATDGKVNGQYHPDPYNPRYVHFVNNKPVGWGGLAVQTESPLSMLKKTSKVMVKTVLKKDAEEAFKEAISKATRMLG